MPILHQVWEKLEEIGHDQQANVHAVHIRIGSNYNLSVTEIFDAVLNVECMLKEVKLLILINHLLGHSKAVERLATKGKNRLGLHIPAFGNRARSRISFGDE